MATIQIRDIPEDVYETIRQRARRAGQSLQAYMRGQIVAQASRPTSGELLEEWERELHEQPTGVTVEEIVRILREERNR
jgi:plasmid stability protein